MDPMGNTSFLKAIRPSSISMIMGGIGNGIPGVECGKLSCQIIATSHEPRKKPSYFLLYWMVNRDPYNGLL